ncbi:MAG TPA: hypothetical protein VF133_17555 [Terriglobales bacterium]
MGTEKYSGWRRLYRDALLEPDPVKLSQRIEEAYEAIRGRRCQLWESGATGVRERSELDAASYFLALLGSIAAKSDRPEPLTHTNIAPASKAS